MMDINATGDADSVKISFSRLSPLATRKSQQKKKQEEGEYEDVFARAWAPFLLLLVGPVRYFHASFYLQSGCGVVQHGFVSFVG